MALSRSGSGSTSTTDSTTTSTDNTSSSSSGSGSREVGELQTTSRIEDPARRAARRRRDETDTTGGDTDDGSSGGDSSDDLRDPGSGGGGHVGVGRDEPTDPTGGESNTGAGNDTGNGGGTGGGGDGGTGGGYVGVGRDEPTNPSDVETGGGNDTVGGGPPVGGPPGTVQRDDGTLGPDRDTAAGDPPDPGGGPGGYTGGPGTTLDDSDPTDPDSVDPAPQRNDFDTDSDYVEASAEYQFDTVDQNEIYTRRDGTRIEPRFTERGAHQAIEQLTGSELAPGDVSFSDDGQGITIEEVNAKAQALADDIADRSDVARQQLDTARDVAAFEAGQQAREDAQQRREQATEGIAAQARSEGIDPDRLEAQTGRDIDQDGHITTPSQYVAQQVQSEFSTLERGEDFQVVQDDGVAQVEYTDDGVQAVERELEARADGALDYTVSRGEDGGIEATAERREQFGDIDWSMGLGGPGDEVEGALNQASDAIQGGVDVVADASSYVNPLAQVERGVTAASTEGVGVTDALTGNVEAGLVEESSESFVRGAGLLVDVPGLVRTAQEGTEYAVDYAAPKVASGEGGEAYEETGAAVGSLAGQAIQEFERNPVTTTATIGGTVVGSYGAIRGASAVSGRAGAAARYAIQPGEEVAVRGLTRAARRTATGQRAISATPGDQLDFGDVARYTGQRVARNTPSLQRLVSGDVTDLTRPDTVDTTPADAPTQAYGRDIDTEDVDTDLANDFDDTNLESEFEPDAPERGGPSEPLGSGGRDELVGPTDQPQQLPDDVDTTPTADTATTRDLPLRERIQEAGGVRPFIRGEDLPSRIPSDAMSDSLQRFLDDSRGMAEVPGTGMAVRLANRGETTTNPDPDGFTDWSQTGDDLATRALEQRRQYEGDYEGQVDPVGGDTPQATFILREADEFDADTGVVRDANARRRDAEASSLTESDTELTRFEQLGRMRQREISVLDDALFAEEEELAVEVGELTQADTQDSLGLNTRTGSFADAGVDTGVRSDTSLDVATDTETDLAQELDSEQTDDTDSIQRIEQEVRQEFDGRSRFEQALRTESESRGRPVLPEEEEDEDEQIVREFAFVEDEFDTGIADVDDLESDGFGVF